MWITEEAPGFAVWEAVFQGRWLAWGLSFLLVPPPAVEEFVMQRAKQPGFHFGSIAELVPLGSPGIKRLLC